MEFRRLLGTDLDVSVLCYGPMRAARDRSSAEWRQNARAMEAAIERGVNFIHSSYEYGVRWMMHEVLKDDPKRADLHHVIKVPVPDWDDAGFDPGKFEARVDEALKDLHTQRIALVQWMWRVRPDDEAHRLPLLAGIIDDVTACFGKLRDKGKVGHLGCFPYYPDSGRAAMANPAIRVLIAYYNPLELEMAPLIEQLAAEDRGFLAIRPLYQGVLTDRFAAQSEMPDGHRLKSAQMAPIYARRAALADAVPEIGERGMTGFALRFPLLSSNCASVIVGMNSEEQVESLCGHVQGVTANDAEAARIRRMVASA